MSESAVILEGEVARRFNPVDKLRVTNQDSSVSDWVPSDTLDLGSLMASENTLYLANIDDDCDAYEEVEVDVSEELEDGDYKKITGKGNDGNDYAVGLDENGNLDVEHIPAAIRIVVPPRKLKYEDGETIDFTGIHVYLMDGNNQRYTDEDYPTGEIPFDELMFPVNIADFGGSGGGVSNEAYFHITYGSYEKTSVGTFYDNQGDVFIAGCFCIGRTEQLKIDRFSLNFVYASYENFKIKTHSIDTSIGERDIYPNVSVKEVSGERFYYGTAGYAVYFGTPVDSLDFLATPAEEISVSQYTNENWVEFAYNILQNPPSDTQTIPVEWMRGDGKTLEDTFTIEPAHGEPIPEPPPDPWADNCDFIWAGRGYNINSRMVPQATYSDGIVRIPGVEREYTVLEAEALGIVVYVKTF